MNPSNESKKSKFPISEAVSYLSEGMGRDEFMAKYGLSESSLDQLIQSVKEKSHLLAPKLNLTPVNLVNLFVGLASLNGNGDEPINQPTVAEGEHEEDISDFRGNRSDPQELKPEKRRKTKGISIGILGLRASGKTTYLATLIEILRDQGSKFGHASVENVKTQDYLNQLMERIKNGQRVSPTDPLSGFVRISLSINRKGDPPIEIETFDYAGEKADRKDQAQLGAELKHCNGLLVLLPPEAAQSSKVGKDMRDSVDTLFGVLTSTKTKTRTLNVVAIVITKADELKKGNMSDQEIRDHVNSNFGPHIKRIKSRARHCELFIASSLGDNYRFTDTPTNQNPEPYQIKESFEWVVEKIKDVKLRNRRGFILRVIMTLLFLMSIGSYSAKYYNGIIEKRIYSHTSQLESLRRPLTPKDSRAILETRRLLLKSIEDHESQWNMWPLKQEIVKETKDAQLALKEIVDLLLEDLKLYRENTLSEVRVKINRIHEWLTNYPELEHGLEKEKTRLESLENRLILQKKYEELVAEIDDYSAFEERANRLQEALAEEDWNDEQRARIQDQIRVFRKEGAKDAWARILADNNKLRGQWERCIRRFQDFRVKFPQESNEYPIDREINNIYKLWDQDDYNTIRSTFQRDLVNSIDSVKKMCDSYLESSRPFKRFETPVKNFLDWYNSLEKTKGYRVQVFKVIAPPSHFANGVGDTVSVDLRVGTTHRKTIEKVTGSNSTAQDLGTFRINWAIGDPISLRLTFHKWLGRWRNHHLNASISGRLTLAYLAGKVPITFKDDPNRTQVILNLKGNDSFFEFPSIKDFEGIK